MSGNHAVDDAPANSRADFDAMLEHLPERQRNHYLADLAYEVKRMRATGDTTQVDKLLHTLSVSARLADNPAFQAALAETDLVRPEDDLVDVPELVAALRAGQF